jgi:hypothetical protein
MQRLFALCLSLLLLSPSPLFSQEKEDELLVAAPTTGPATKPAKWPGLMPVKLKQSELKVNAAEGEFCVIALPDTQVYAAGIPEIYEQQTQFIKDKMKELNILAVVHEGDIVDRNAEDAQWAVAKKAHATIDGLLPFFVIPGNHDRDKEGYQKFDANFPLENAQKQPGWGGSMDGKSIKNAYYFFEAPGGRKFMVVGLEYGPPDDVLTWAGEIIAKHPDHQVIIVTHAYMYGDNTRQGKGDLWNPATAKNGRNDGELMWEKLVRKHKNIFLVLSGHVRMPGGRLTSTGDNGNAVHQLLANYQSIGKGGGGYLRIHRFVPKENKIYVDSYSPTAQTKSSNPDHTFVLDYTMSK